MSWPARRKKKKKNGFSLSICFWCVSPSDHVFFRHVKTLESRSQLLETALASADEANRRWEECRTLVDQLRIENTALRAALSQAQIQLGQISQASQQQQQHQPQPRDCKEEKTETPTTKSDG